MIMWRKVGWEWGKDCHAVLLHIAMNCVHSSCTMHGIYSHPPPPAYFAVRYHKLFPCLPQTVWLLTTSSLIAAISAISSPITAARGEDALTIAASKCSTLTRSYMQVVSITVLRYNINYLASFPGLGMRLLDTTLAGLWVCSLYNPSGQCVRF